MAEITAFKYHDIGTDSLNGRKHFHDFEFEILHILSGDGVMMIKDRLYPIVPNTVFFVSGKNAHCSAPLTPSNYMRNKIIFSKEHFLSVVDRLSCAEAVDSLFMNGGSAVKLSADSSMKIDECFLKISELTAENEGITTLRFFINLLSILDIAIQSRERTVPCIKNKVSEIIEYINKNIDKKLSLDDISHSTGISKYYLCHSFAESVGMTVFEYIRFTRLAKAKELLLDTTCSVAEIALAVGYESIAYFSKVFREQENMTPTRFRKNARKP